MANVSISYEEMTAAAARLGAGRDEITAKLQDLQRQIQALVGSGFVTDRASKRLESVYLEYTSSANTAIDRLTEIQQFITQAAAAHRSMDDEIAARIG